MRGQCPLLKVAGPRQDSSLKWPEEGISGADAHLGALDKNGLSYAVHIMCFDDPEYESETSTLLLLAHSTTTRRSLRKCGAESSISRVKEGSLEAPVEDCWLRHNVGRANRRVWWRKGNSGYQSTPSWQVLCPRIHDFTRILERSRAVGSQVTRNTVT